ncbi:alpha/beta fold hydrolase [Altericista sp. CCNU0014]|uniref:alpha/beta fold hydrolase n=1 Tax=Altericista sp. CCNU0014 TaxID=3082949 RepID=UPI00384D2BAA
MTERPEVLWLNGSPSLQCFDRPLLSALAVQAKVRQWQYCQGLDEGSSVQNAVRLLHDYLEQVDRPIHLMGHGVGGTIGLLYARYYPEKVRSLALLSVAEQPAMTWQTHYYVQRHLMSCSRHQVLAFMVRSLFGSELPYDVKNLIRALDRDLSEAPCLHSLFRIVDLPKGGILAPLMVCGSQTDSVVHPPALLEWRNWMKPTDTLWECTTGRHFFHYFQPQQVAEEVFKFWRSDAFETQKQILQSSESYLAF